MKDLDSASLAPNDPDARTRALLSYAILDTSPEAAFDDLARLASQICGTPSALITFIDDHRQFLKASIGENRASDYTLDAGFCPFTVAKRSLLLIPDTLADPRFADHPASHADPAIRFYAGVPIFSHDDYALGTLCVIDYQPRELMPDQIEALQVLGRQVESQLDLRRLAETANKAEAAARRSEARLQGIADALPVLIAYVDAAGRYQFNNIAYEEWVGLPRNQVTGRTMRDVLGEEFYAVVAGNVKTALSGKLVTYERNLTWPDGTTRSVRGIYAPQRGPGGDVEGFAVLVTDDTENKRLAAERKASADRHAALVAAQQEVANAERSLDAVLNIVTHHAMAMVAAEGAIVEMADGQDMVYRAASGGAAAHVGMRLRRETSLSGRCVAEGRLLYCKDSESDDRVDRDACRRIGLRSMVVVPLTFLGRTVGVLKVYSAHPDAYSDDDLSLLELIVSLAISALSAFSELEARNALSLSEQRLHALISSVPVILFALDANGVFTQAEGKGLEALDLSPSDLVGRSYRDAFATDAALLEGMARGLSGIPGQWLWEVSSHFLETQYLPLTRSDGLISGLIGVAFDVTERVNAERALRQSAARQRQFLRDVLASVTEGRLTLCQSASELPPPLVAAMGDHIAISMEGGLKELRQATRDACAVLYLSDERCFDMITAVSEAGMNCAVHAVAGVAEVFTDSELGTVQVRIMDHGTGIALENLPHATLRKGYTTAGTLGHGMKMMLQTADRIFLLTGPTGTTVVVEQDRVAPPSIW